MVPFSERIGLLPIPGFEYAFNFLLNRHAVDVTIIMWLISPVGLWVIRLLAGRILRLSDEWVSFLADFVLGMAVASAVQLVQSLPNRPLQGAWLTASRLFQVVVLVGCVVVAITHVRQERRKGHRHHLMPTALYHNLVLYVAIGFPLLFFGVIGVIFAPWSPWLIVLRIVIIIAVGAWIMAARYDDANQSNPQGRSKHELAHGTNEWWWQGGWREFPYWWKRLYNPSMR